jgi:hypothetical protein
MSSILSSRMYYINSATRISGSNQAFTVPITIPADSEYDHIALIDCSIPLTYYNLDSPFNTFTLKEGSLSVLITIPSGNYNVLNFQTTLIPLLNSLSPNGFVYSMTFNSVTAMYTYSVTGNAGVQPSFIFTDFVVSQMGFSMNSSNSFLSSSLVSQDVISFVATQTLFITCDLINDSNNILQSVSANNAIPYSFIAYQCPNVEHYGKKLTTNLHSTVSISLIDALGQEINLNGIDWTISLLLYKKNNLTTMFRSFLNFVSAVTSVKQSSSSVA